MKKMISKLLVAILTILSAANHSAAQGGDKNIAFIPAKNEAAYRSFMNEYARNGEAVEPGSTATDKAAKAALKATKANSKALKNFGNIYKKESADASWSVTDNAIVATFNKDEVKTNVVYNKKGNWLHSLTYYPENKTPEDISSVIDYAYPKDDIRLTIKVEEGGIVFYIVQLENKTSLRKVTVYEGETNLIEELTKSK